MIENANPTWYDRVLDKGERKERAKALCSYRSLLSTLIKTKFGDLSEQDSRHINTISDYDTLQQMCIAVTTASSVSAVFAVGA